MKNNVLRMKDTFPKDHIRGLPCTIQWNQGVITTAIEMHQMKVLPLQQQKKKKHKRNPTKERYNMFQVQ